MAALALTLTACGRPHVGPLPPPPYRSEIEAHYDRTWAALIRALARENLPLRAVARDSGVISSDDTITPIGLWADCGTIGDDRLEGEAMRTQAFRRGSSGSLKPQPVYPCASTGRFEANLLETVRSLVKE